MGKMRREWKQSERRGGEKVLKEEGTVDIVNRAQQTKKG